MFVSKMKMATLLLLMLATGTGAKSAEKQPRLDLYGEPLPQGAIARMGTIQFRHPPPDASRHIYLYLPEPPTTGVAFSPDGQVIATHRWDRLRLWNANTGKFLFEIKNSDLHFTSNHVFSPDGRFLAATAILEPDSPDKGPEAYVCLWDAKTGRLRHRCPPENGLGHYIRHILFSPDSKLLAMTHEKGTIHLWNTDTGKEVAVLPPISPNNGTIAFIAFSPDGKTLVIMPYMPGNRIWHWDVAKGEIRKDLSLEANKETRDWQLHHGGTIENWQLSNDGRTLACQLGRDGIVRLLDPSTGKVRCKIQAQVVPPCAPRMTFTPDGRFFAMAEFAGWNERELTVSLWDTETGKLKRRFTIAAERPAPLTFSPDGSRVAIGPYYVRLYDVASGKELLSKPAHEGTVTSLAFTPDSSTLISGGADGMIGIWNAATGKGRHFIQANRWRGAVTGVALVPGGSTFVSCGLGGIICLNDWRTVKEVRRFSLGAGVAQFKELRVSGDGKTVIGNVYTGNQEGPFHSWDLATGKLIKSYPKQGNADYSNLTEDGKHFIGVKYSTRLADNGQAQRDGNSTVEIRELVSGRQVFTMRETDPYELKTQNYQENSGLLTPDGRLLIRATATTIRLRELLTGKERLSIAAKEGGLHRYEKIALSPDGRILATAKDNKTLQLWDLFTGKELLRYSGYPASVQTMTFSPNGKFLATGHEDATVLVWDVSLPKAKTSEVLPDFGSLPAKELDSYWQDLAGEDAAKAHRAIGNLVGAPEQAVALLKDRLRSVADKSERIAKLIAQLNDKEFAAREAASKELETLGSKAEPALRLRLNQKISLEERRRIDAILDRPAMPVRDPELLRGIRAIEVLETIAISGARASRLAAIDLLKKLTGGTPEAWLTQEAKAALRRLQTRNP